MSNFLALAALLLFGFARIVSSDAGGTMDPNGSHAFAGCGMDPDGCRGTSTAATAASDQGGGLDPDGRTRAARAAAAAGTSSDQGGGVDPDGKPSR